MDNKLWPILRVVDGPNEGAIYEVHQERIVVGRSSAVDWVLPYTKISREHVEIFWREGHWWLRDLNSKNHTYCDGSKVPLAGTVILRDGTKVQLASELVFEFCDNDSTSAETNSQILSKGLWINPAREEVFINNSKLIPALPPQLYHLLEAVWKQNGKVVDNEQICAALWPDAPKDSFKNLNLRNTIDQYFSHLQARLRKEDPQHEYIETVKGKGRRFVQKA